MQKIITRSAAEILDRVGAVLTGSHFVYTSGKHGESYINKDALYPFTKETGELCTKIALAFEDEGVEAVIAPAVGGVILSTWTAQYLSNIYGRQVFGLYADKAKDPHGDDTFVIKRGYDKLISGKRVLVVEDLLTTGGSVKKVVQEVRKCGGEVVGVGVLANRGNVTPAQIGDVPKLVSLMDIELQMFDEKDCPFCKEGRPINTDIGHGKKFQEKRKR